MIAPVDSAPASLPRTHQALSRARRFVRRGPRWLRIGLYAVVGTFLVYLLAANVILRTSLLRGWISDDESTLRLEYRSAWSLYPGHVAIRDLSLRYQDSNIQMLILLERATLKIDLFALTKRTLRVSKLTAEGTTFRMREKVEPFDGAQERVRAFPPIEGYGDPPIEHKVPQPPIPDDQYKLWSIDLPDISASLREVWTMELRYRGEGTVRGGFYLKPQRNVWVLPSVMLTHGGVFSLGDRDLIRGGDSQLDARIAPFDVREVPGVQVLRYLSGRIQQQGELVLSAIAATYLPKDARIEVTGGSGPVTVDLEVARGVLQPSTRVTFHTDAVAAHAPSLAVQTDLDLIAHVDASGERSTVIIETSIAHATGTPLEVRGARAMVDLGNADIAAPFHIARASGSVTSAHSGDLRAWQPFAPENTSFQGGSATLSGRAEVHGGALEGRLDLALEKARMAIGTFAFATSGKVWTNVVSEDVEKAVAFPGTGLDLHDVALRLESGHAEGLWARARLENARLSRTPPLGFDTDLAVDSGPGDRTLALFTRLASLPDIAAEAASGTQLAASLHLRVRPGLIALAVTSAKDGPLESRGRVQKRAASPLSGAFLLRAGPFRAGLDVREGHVSVVPLAGDGWLDEQLQKR